MEHRLVPGRLAYCFSQFIQANIFEHIRKSTSTQGGKDILIFVVGGKYYYLGMGAGLLDLACRLYTTDTRHNQVHQHDIGNKFCRFTYSSLARVSLTYDSEIW